MRQNDTHTVHDYENGRSISLPEDPYAIRDGYSIARSSTGRESVLCSNTRIGRNELIVPDALLDTFVDAVLRLKDLRDGEIGDQVVESLRGTEDGIALAEALERRVA